MAARSLDLDAADLRIRRGSVPASTQLAEALKAAIVEQRLPRGGRLPSERELIDRSGLSRVTVRAATGHLERQGWLVRRQGLGTFVANPVNQELGFGVRTITEVLASSGITPQVDVLSHRVEAAPQRIAETLGLSKVLRISRRFRDGDLPLALLTAYFPPYLGKAVEPLTSKAPGAETRYAMESTYKMWEQRLGVRIARARHEIHAAGASLEVAGALNLPLGSPVLVLERTSYTDDDKPLEVVEFHYPPERYTFSVTLPRKMPEPGAGIVERRDPA
ncbi:GntR family transcriptional regulator [Mycobacterium malmoense]|uniref:GntR family transcriptional regulator n=1 Tax=Mycobacterium malmoense TaxID=1780 RepID=A0ABX3SWC1_MYCMA|nr:GntR family transcriptional regulator [Mycobacterium malmoense]OIN80803.1 GntR family transcriptional regulator [Mycobacterium malmoense]ORA84541.1 GntR family transcriptional regulator [Mycobacterium malmoense]QZA17203.1 GntR family transcriptional regulator [Mycobacterium malmoense]UNB93994.1 GntR family transcriptional regulator [Mycobacterium malmoense]